MLSQLIDGVKTVSTRFCCPAKVKLHDPRPKPSLVIPTKTPKGHPNPKALKLVWLMANSKSGVFKNLHGDYKMFTPWGDFKVDKRTVLNMVTTGCLDRNLKITVRGREWLDYYDVRCES
jgi:hypothetical protein